MNNMTKIEAFGIALQVLETINNTDEINETKTDEIEAAADIIKKEIIRLQKVAKKDKERRAEKAAEGDELRSLILQYLGENIAKSATMITEEMTSDGIDITRNKVTARLTQLVKAGIITKEQGKTTAIKDGKKTTNRVMLYTYTTTEE